MLDEQTEYGREFQIQFGQQLHGKSANRKLD